jgi:SAM-dependent methyltransferase
MRHRAETRARELGRTLRWVGEDAENVDIADGSVNALVSTFTACTIADPARVLSTLRPALRQGGELRCVEHGIAPDESVRRWQRRLEPLHIALADGCHLMRDPLGIVRDAGYDDTASSSRYLHRRQKWIYVTSLRAVPREV